MRAAPLSDTILWRVPNKTSSVFLHSIVTIMIIYKKNIILKRHFKYPMDICTRNICPWLLVIWYVKFFKDSIILVFLKYEIS